MVAGLPGGLRAGSAAALSATCPSTRCGVRLPAARPLAWRRRVPRQWTSVDVNFDSVIINIVVVIIII